MSGDLMEEKKKLPKEELKELEIAKDLFEKQGREEDVKKIDELLEKI